MGRPASQQSAFERYEEAFARAVVDRQLLSVAERNEALEHQVLMGGHLATAIWELGLASHQAMAQISSEILGLPLADEQMVARVPAKTLKILSRDFVKRHRIIPLGVHHRVLSVATCEPWDLRALDEAAFAGGFKTRILFLPEVSLVRLMHKLYAIPMSPRFRLRPQMRVRSSTAAPKAEAPDTSEDLMGEDTFNLLYASASPSSDPEAITPSPSTPPPAAHPTAQLPSAPPLLRVVPPPATADSETESANEDVHIEILDEIEPYEEIEINGDAQAAMAAIDAAEDRDGVGRALMPFLLAQSKRVVLLTRSGELWMGWMGAGEGIDNDRVRTLMVPSEKGTCFGLVGLTGSFSIGPANAGNAVMRRFLDALGKATPVTVGLFPIHYGGRIVFGIYMDNGDGAVAGTDISDILIVAQRASAALTRLVRSRQAAG